jgi:Na+-transporting methylmalonyl-CoA/oxaloacetate decarboxylase gamma subunit
MGMNAPLLFLGMGIAFALATVLILMIRMRGIALESDIEDEIQVSSDRLQG